MKIEKVTASGLFCQLTLTAGVGLVLIAVAQAAPVVPGSGEHLSQVGDDFEDESWDFVSHSPKSSEDIDDQQRLPTGKATNKRWYEGIKRGYPDMLERVEPPRGGLPGSRGALLMQTFRSGIPGSYTHKMGQDDFVADCVSRLGGALPVWQSPNVVVRVFVPPLEHWEDRTGPSFGFRLSVDTHAWVYPGADEDRNFRPRRGQKKVFKREKYWPGLFAEFSSETDRGREKDEAYWRIRGDQRGRPVRGPAITEAGWWTLGMSCSADGMIHYYAKPGVEDLSASDLITSQLPYGYRCERFRTFFFDVCNQDDGRTWSTPWIVDDCEVYFVPGNRTAIRSKSTQR